MTLGSALVLITLILIIAAGGFYATRHKKWFFIGKIAGAILSLAVLVNLGVWAWHQYQNRPQIVTGVGGVSLGMTPVEVTLAVGKPKANLEGSERDTDLRYIYLGYNDELDYFVRFSNKGGEHRAVLICSSNFLRKVLGFSKYDSEGGIIKKLGEPTSVSVREDGLQKTISYKQWKAAFGIEQGEVETVCATESGEVKYLKEHE